MLRRGLRGPGLFLKRPPMLSGGQPLASLRLRRHGHGLPGAALGCLMRRSGVSVAGLVGPFGTTGPPSLLVLKV